MIRINSDQNKELERIDETKNYPGKLRSLAKDLKNENAALKRSNEKLMELQAMKKKQNIDSMRLEDQVH